MKWLIKKKLKKLLRNNLNIKWIHENWNFIQTQGFIEYEEIKILQDEATEIYKRRAEFANGNVYLVEGYENLLKNLEKHKTSYVRVHSFVINSMTFIVFTNSKTNILIGNLKSTVKKK